MKRAVVYARYSSDNQTEQSIEGQIRVCNDYAARNDIVIVDTYIDRAMTGTNDKRTAFQKMLLDSNKKAWDIVLVYKLDRFSRNKYEMATHKKTLRDNGIKLVSAMENIPDTPEGIILESLLEGMAEYYSAELSQKVRRGMRESREKGLYTGGWYPYGYKIVDRKVEIDKDEAEIVRFIYEEYAKGVIVPKIMEQLEQKGIKYRGRPFARNTIYHILGCEKYSGIYHFKGETYDNIYPRLLPEELFNLVAKRNEDNHYGKRSTETVYLLRGKIFCGYCGKSINADTGTGKNGLKYRFYKCFGKKRGNGCRKASVRKVDVEQLVIDTTLKVLNTDKNIALLADKIYQMHRNRAENDAVLKLLEKEYNQTCSKIDNLLDAITQGIVTSSTKSKLVELESLRDELNAKIQIEKTKLIMELNRGEIIKFIKRALEKKPKQMIDLLVHQIILYDDKMVIQYNYTNSKSPDDDHQGFLYCTVPGAMPVDVYF